MSTPTQPRPQDAGLRDRGEAEPPVVLVTGASGLIGVRTAHALAPEYSVVGLDIEEPPDTFPEGAFFVECGQFFEIQDFDGQTHGVPPG